MPEDHEVASAVTSFLDSDVGGHVLRQRVDLAFDKKLKAAGVLIVPIVVVLGYFGIQDWRDAGASEGEIAFSCVGRRLDGQDAFDDGKGPCTYAGGGLFKLNPVHVTRSDDGTVRQCFDFAEADGVKPWADL